MKARLATGALLGFVLVAAAACGGSDGLSTAEEEALQERTEAAEKAAQEALDAAKAAQEAAEEAEKARKEAEERAETAEEAQQQAEQAQQQAEQAQQQAEQAQQQQQQQLQQQQQQQLQQQQQQQQQLQQQLTEAEQAELRARASSFGAELDDGAAATVTLSWLRGRSNLQYNGVGTLTPGSAAPSVPGGWRSNSFTGHSGTANALVDETVYLYTNIQSPRSRNFWKVHNVEVASPAEDNTANDPTPTGTPRVVRVGSNPLDHGDAATFDIAVSGTYDGVSGTYTCAGCTIDESDGDTTDITAADFEANDYVTGTGSDREFVAGTDWSFTPGSITALVKAEDQADQDDAYLFFGIWSSIPDNISGTTYDFRHIVGGGAQTGSDLTSTSDGLAGFNDLVGPATFRGGAVGRYVTQGQVGGQNAKIGTFTATATLNADFGAAGTAGTISGSITDFQEDGSALTGWRVTLGLAENVGAAAPIADAAVATQTNGTVANIGGLSVGGDWGATFYGSNNQELTDRDKYPATSYPPVDLAGVVGWFNAAGPGAGTDPNDVSLAGAFAATRSN